MPLTVDELHDFIRLVETHLEWRAELRRLVLTEELLSLPAQVATLTDRVTSLAEAQQRTEAQVTTLTRLMQTLTDDVGTLKGKSLEADYRAKGQSIGNSNGLFHQPRAPIALYPRGFQAIRDHHINGTFPTA